jgi:hypothetical protein
MATIENSEALTKVFGTWPSFHDAEVVSVVLDRQGQEEYGGPTVDLVVHVFEMTSEVDNKGYYVLRHHTLVRFRFFQVVELFLEGFNHQNALFALDITDISGRQMELVRFSVKLHSSFGVGAEFECRAVCVISAEPFIPTEPPNRRQRPPRFGECPELGKNGLTHP